MKMGQKAIADRDLDDPLGIVYNSQMTDSDPSGARTPKESSAAQRSAAWASLYNAVSVAFAYPSQRLYEALRDGSFIHIVMEAMAVVPMATSECLALQSGVADTVNSRTLIELETEYISLFEANQDLPPLHPYAHLYDPKEADRISMLRRLQSIYREYGLILKSDEGADQPDHLTVEVEFLAYLHNLLSAALAGEQGRTVAALEKGLRSFQKELEWVPTFVSLLEKRSNHPFYVPVGHLLTSMLENRPSL